VSYHPLLFHPTTRLVAGRSAPGRAWRLASAGVGLLVTHTDFDSCPGGTADALARTLGLDEVRQFGPVEGATQVKVVVFAPEESVDALAAAMAEAGAGQIGNYQRCSFRTRGVGSFTAGPGASPAVGGGGQASAVAEERLEIIAPKSAQAGVIAALVAAHPYEEPAFDVYEVASNQGLIGRVGRWQGSLGDLVGLVADTLGSTALRVAGGLNAEVGRVAVVPGSGSSFLDSARAAGADVIVTGDVDHHRAVGALDRGLAVIDPGHAATELPGVRSLAELVSGLGVEVTDVSDDRIGPWVDMSAGPLP
jgi:putative NIF3 family GTP cyclohydrolase 1 type 2